MMIANNNSYGSHFCDKFSVRVRYRTDMVEGAWHSPEDMLGWFMSMPYIMYVELECGKFFKDMPPWVLEKEE